MLAALLLFGLLASQYADWYTTKVGLELGAAEANPLISTVIETYGIKGVLVLKIAFAIGAWLYTRKRPTAGWFLVLGFFAVSAWNLHQISTLLAV